MGTIQSGIVTNGAPSITSLSRGDTFLFQKGRPYTPGNVPTATGGRPPYSFSAPFSFPAGITVNPSTGEVSGTPTEGTFYNGSFGGLLLRVADSRFRFSERYITSGLFKEDALGFAGGSNTTTATGTSGVRGISIPPVPAGGAVRRVERINNGSVVTATWIEWYGPVVDGYSYPASSDFELFATVISGTVNPADAGNFGSWRNLGSTVSLRSNGGTISFTVELRPVGGSTIGATTFSFT